MKCPMPNTPVPDVALASALARILWRCAGGGPIVLAKWVAEPGGDIAEEPLDAASVGDVDALAQALLPQVPPSLRARGGCCLFCYSCILTHGVDKVAAEAALEGGATPLVSGPSRSAAPSSSRSSSVASRGPTWARTAPAAARRCRGACRWRWV